jgi:putative solute:sodium symporter small subunit
MNQAYKKECFFTLLAFAVVTLLTHIYPMYFLFPGLTQMTMFGFPAHYFLTLVIGWLVLIPLYWIYIPISEKIDAEIRGTSEAEEAQALEAAKGGAE